MRAYVRSEGTVMVVDNHENRIVEFKPIRKNGNVTGDLPFSVGGDMLKAVQDCYSFMGWPAVSFQSKIFC